MEPAHQTSPAATLAGPRSPLLDTAGAVADGGLDGQVAAHYGDPMREQRLLSEGLGVVDLSNRGVLTMTGRDRLRLLHSLTTQHLLDLTPGSSAETAILSPQGRIEHLLHVVDDGERTWITVEPGTAEEVARWLDSMRFMLDVAVQDVSDAFAVLGEPVGRAGNSGEPPTWVDPWPGPVGDTVEYGPPAADHPALGRAWREVLVPRADQLAAVGDRDLVGIWAAEALRAAAWRPRGVVDVDDRTIPHELDLLRTAVHMHKGCYRGQETVAKVHNLGRPPRRVAFLHLDGSGHVLPDAGDPITAVAGGRPVGRITTVARHHEDGPIALAVLKRSVDPEVDLLVGESIAAAQTVIVRP